MLQGWMSGGWGRALSVLVPAVCCLSAGVAVADCLTGMGATGLEVGTQTLSVSLVNSSPATALSPISCTEVTLTVDPGSSVSGAGKARFIANHLGYRGYTAVISGGEASGSGAASVGGAVRYIVRVDSTPSYAGPTTVNVDFSMLVAANGAIAVSGTASAGGTFSTEMTLRPVGEPGIVLFNGNGALAGASPVLLQNTAPVDIDSDYELQIAHSQIVNISTSFNPMGGQLGTASSGGTVAISYGAGLTVADPDLSIGFPMVDALGVSPPSLGNPPVFPIGVPASSAPGIAALVLSLLLVALVSLGRRGRGY